MIVGGQTEARASTIIDYHKLFDESLSSDLSATNQGYSRRPKDSTTSEFVRGKSVFIGREVLATQLTVNSNQRKEITGCNWGFDFGLFRVISYLKEDIFQYRNNLDKQMEKLLLLENIDFTLTTNGKLITEIVYHLLQAPAHEK